MQKLGLYIHIPFCVKKCLYCDFYSITDKKHIPAYLDALVREIDGLKDKKFTSVYIGGGSPSILSSEEMAKLFQSLNKLHLENCEEITAEANPSQITAEKLKCWLNLGINRISIGVQSFNDVLLKKVGRIHDGKQAIDAIKLAKNAGFKNISLDLIYGLPGENIFDLKEDIKKAVDLCVEHISAYSLTLEENTPLFKMVEENKLSLPVDEAAEEMYDTVCEEFPKMGYERYEISNFAKKGFECKHNTLYWSDFPYVGAGSCASSYIDGIRYKNIASVREYIYNINHNIEVSSVEERSEDAAIFEYIFLALRKTEGLNKGDFSHKFKDNIETMFKKEIEELKNLDLLKESRDYIRLTPKGFKLSNMVFEKFI